MRFSLFIFMYSFHYQKIITSRWHTLQDYAEREIDNYCIMNKNVSISKESITVNNSDKCDMSSSSI